MKAQNNTFRSSSLAAVLAVLVPSQVERTMVEPESPPSMIGSSAIAVAGAADTIRNNDARPYLGAKSPSVAEGDAGRTTLTFTARLTDENGRVKTSGRPIKVSYRVSSEDGATATAGKDYVETSGTLTFEPGETVKTIDVTVVGDTEDEDDETLTLRWTGWDGDAVLLVSYTVTGTIVDDDGPMPYLGADSPSVTEGDAGTTTLTFTARLTDENGRTRTSSRAVTASYRVSSEDGATATAGKDYRETSGDLTFAPGETVGTIDVTVLGDTEDEDDETLTLRWTDWDGDAVLLARYTETGTIVDDDEAPPVVPATLSIADAEADEGDEITFAVTLDKAVPGGLTVTPSFTDGTATAGADYKAGAGALAFAGTAGERRTFAVATTDDDDVEDDETFTVRLAVSGTTTAVTATSTATGTIRDDDVSPPVVPAALSIADAEADEGDDITFAITLDKAVPGGLTVTPSLTDGTATAGVDYKAGADALAFAGTAGERRTFAVATTDDDDVEDDETFTVRLAVSGATAAVTATASATGTIRDDDVDDDESGGGGDTRIDLSVSRSTATEEGGAVSVTVTATSSAAVAANTAVTVSVGRGTATSGTDYEAVTDFPVEIPAGGTTAQGAFKLTPIDDGDPEGSEIIVVSGVAASMTVTEAHIMLTDDDGAQASNLLGVTLAVNPTSMSEYGGRRKVYVYGSVTIWGVPLYKPRHVRVSVGKTGDSAVEGTDYGAVDDFDLYIPVGRQSGSAAFYLHPTNDYVRTGDRTISITGKLPGRDPVTGTSMTLTDDDPEKYTGPNVTLSVVPEHVSENAGAADVTVTATSTAYSSDRRVMVSLSAGGGTATWGVDYNQVQNFDIIIPKGQTSATGTFELRPVIDGVAEGDETIWITGQVNGSGSHLTGTTLTLSDDSQVTLSANPSSIGEGDGVTTVTVTATTTTVVANDAGVVVTVGRSGDSAKRGTDYTDDIFLWREITIPANQTSGTMSFQLTPTQDTLPEGDEQISLWGGSTRYAQVNDGTITLTDDDRFPTVALSANPSSVGEGAGATSVTVTATAVSAASVARQVAVSVGGTGTATSGTDYAPVTALTVTIPANANQRDGYVHAYPDERRAGRGQRDHRPVRHQPPVDRYGKHRDAGRRRQARDHAVGESVERERGGERDDGDREGRRLAAGPVRDLDHGVGGRRRHGDLGHRLRGGVELHHRHRGGRHDGDGDVHAHAGPGLGLRRPRNHRRRRNRDGPDGERRGHRDDRRRPGDADAVGEPVESEGERQRDPGDGDGDGRDGVVGDADGRPVRWGGREHRDEERRPTSSGRGRNPS